MIPTTGNEQQEPNHQEEENKIVIKAEDIQTEKDEFDLAIEEARNRMLEDLQDAKDLPTFLNRTHAVRSLVPHNLSWAREYGDRASDEWIHDYTEERDIERSKKQAQRAVELATRASELESDASEIRVAIRKEKNKEGFESYYAVAIFPKEEQVKYDVPRVTEAEQDVLYVEFENACVYQACDQVLGDEKETNLTMPRKTIGELYKLQGFDPSATLQQNFRIRNEQGETVDTRDPKHYIQTVLKGGFSNEETRYLISDFLEMRKNKS